MFNKKSLSLLFVLIIGGGLFYAVRSGHHSDPGTRYEQIFHRIGEMLESWHYSPRKIDDKFSKDVFHAYLKTLDPDRHYFLASDLAQLKKYETKIDDELLGAKLEFFYAVNTIYVKRMNESSAIYKQILASPFNFKIKETYVDHPDSLKFGKNEAERKENWRKELKYLVLDRYVDLLEQRDKNKADSALMKKTDAQLEAEAREKVVKLYDRIFERYRNRFKDDDRFHQLVNEIAETMDPHTNYYPPIEKRTFDENMSGEFYGIGASLTEEEGNIKIATVVTGSPAHKSGQIQVGDYIIKVAQGAEEPQDLSGFAVEDAVKLIRGKKGTEVRLTIRKPDGSKKVVSMIREKINIDETYAKSAVITGADNRKIGYIYLPEFYANFNDADGARCAADVAKEIEKLKIEKVEGIILDLRTNGGGSLMDVVQMVGFFIESGPVVQVKSRGESPSMLNDRDNNSVLWKGPLTVMVNEFSASASEIFAAAIQDYGRGIVIGSTSTYGKGTVQRSIGLDRNSWITDNDQDLGNLKMTIQKFYRVNGGSTQMKGVLSDIVLPDQYEYLDYREKSQPTALPWDEIPGTSFKKWQSAYNLNDIIKRSNERVRMNPAFNGIAEQTKVLTIRNKKVYSLEITQFRNEKMQMSGAIKKIDTLTKLSVPLSITNVSTDLKTIGSDSLKIERNRSFINIRKNDIYLGETIEVMNDMIREEKMAQSNIPVKSDALKKIDQ